jgi:hypothetical protein
MDNVVRVREASLRVAKWQRRIWLIQTVILPLAAIVGVVVAVAFVAGVWRRRATPVAPPPVPAQEPVRLNGAVNGN